MAGTPTTVASSAALDHLRWALTPEVGPTRFSRLVERFGSAGAALGATAGQIERIDGIGAATAQQIAAGRDRADVQGEVELAAAKGVRIICPQDEEYPPGLKQISDPPICLYVKGQIARQDAVALGIVGSRRCTIYGREQARRFGQQVGGRGLTVVSGLARGIDGEAHKGALEAGGRTIAVLGNGLSTLYPPEHAELAEQISRAGAVISELPMTTSPDAKNFLPRNRVIAGLSLGVLVIEAARRSGSLTTARLAGEYNREVFAVPGRIDSEFSQGTNALIRDQHAKLAGCIDDIIDELGEVGDALKDVVPEVDVEDSLLAAATARLNEEERQILEALDRQGQSLEAIADGTGQPPGRVASLLVTLQLKGLARQLPGNQFVRAGGRP
ncbi:MAG: DNA-protecting protein DprA [Planctomycetes bacterium]|nr:DNA-protecting protein DprA [Planctomycetota bacterium]